MVRAEIDVEETKTGYAAVLVDLTPNTDHLVRVTARNEFGFSLPSRPVAGSTVAVPKAPERPAVAEVTRTTATLKWTPPKDYVAPADGGASSGSSGTGRDESLLSLQSAGRDDSLLSLQSAASSLTVVSSEGGRYRRPRARLPRTVSRPAPTHSPCHTADGATTDSAAAAAAPGAASRTVSRPAGAPPHPAHVTPLME